MIVYVYIHVYHHSMCTYIGVYVCVFAHACVCVRTRACVCMCVTISF